MQARLRLTRRRSSRSDGGSGGLDERVRRPRRRCGGRPGPGCRTACRAPRCSRSTRASSGSSPRPGAPRSSRCGGPGTPRTSSPARPRAVRAGEAARARQGPCTGRADRRAAPRVSRRCTHGRPEAGLAIRENPRYAAPTGTVAIRWEGAGHRRSGRAGARDEPTRPVASWPGGTCTSSGRRRRWLRPVGGISRRAGADAFAALAASLLAVRSPLGEELVLADDEPAMRAADRAARRACCRAATRTSCWTARSASCSSRGGSAGAALDVAGLAGRAPRRRRDPRTWRRAQHAIRDRGAAAPGARRARCRRGRGSRPAAPRARPGGRRRLERLAWRARGELRL